MTCVARYTRPINGASKGSAMWLVDFPHCSSMNEGINLFYCQYLCFFLLLILYICIFRIWKILLLPLLQRLILFG